jgi:sugar phosphate isomerase/epimerase
MLGVTLFSFTNEWQQRRYTLDQLVAKVAEQELGPGIEAVGYQTFRDFPNVSDAAAAHFRDLVARHGLTPTCLGGDVDIGRKPGHRMTVDEMVIDVERQIAAAKKLGFPILRVQEFIGPEVLLRALPAAERAEVQIVCELYSPLTIESPEVVGLRECFDRAGSPYLGFMPDFSCSLRSVPEGHWANLRRAGASDALITRAKAIWQAALSKEDRSAAFAEAAAECRADAGLVGALNLTSLMYGRMPVDAWREILPYVRHIHGKFYQIDADGQDAAVPYPALMALLKDTGYTGTLSAEWGGSMFTEEDISFEQVGAWRAMCMRLLGD